MHKLQNKNSFDKRMWSYGLSHKTCVLFKRSTVYNYEMNSILSLKETQF